MRSFGKWLLILVVGAAGALVAQPDLLSELSFESDPPSQEGLPRPQLVQSGIGAPVSPVEDLPIPAPTAVPSAEESVYGSCDAKDLKEELKKYSRAEAVLRDIHLVTRGTESLVTLPVAGRKLDLMRLASGVSTLLTELPLPEGEYVEIRLVIGKASLTDGDGRSWPLEIPGGDKEGIRVSLSRVLEIRGDGNRSQVSLAFCTDANFRLDQGEHLGFHPAIQRVFNLSI